MRRRPWSGLWVLAACSFRHGTAPDDGVRAFDAPTPADPPARADAPIDNHPTDSDLDGIPDASDNCPTVANADQADDDSDGRGYVCYNCPHIANAGQADGDADGVGDVCDPNPITTGDHI